MILVKYIAPCPREPCWYNQGNELNYAAMLWTLLGIAAAEGANYA